nr:NepR family anti-sigma factor [Rhodovulum sp. P5]
MPKKVNKGQMQEQIDENLRRAYAQTVEEEVPERFLKLLDQLRNQGAGKPDDKDGSKK